MEKIKYAVLTLLVAAGIALGNTTPVHASVVATPAPVSDIIIVDDGFFSDIGMGAFAGAVVGAYACGIAGAAVGTLAGAVAGAVVSVFGSAQSPIYPENALD